MSTIACTGSDQPQYLEEDFNGQVVSLKAIGGDIHYINVPDRANITSWVVRITEVIESTSGATGTSLTGIGTFTVADGSLYRKGENLPVLSTADARKGAIHITSITANVLTFSQTGIKDNWFSPVSGDKLIRREDSFIAEDDISEIEPKRFKYLIINGSSSSKLVAEIMGTGVKKKY